MRINRRKRAIQFTGIGLVALATIAAATVPAVADEKSDQSRKGSAQNVILLVGDGMGDFELSAARNYSVGAAGRLKLDALPERSTVTTYSVQESDPSAPNYVPDSAATSTAWSTGVKTSNGRIGTTAGTDEDIPTTMELAKEAGLLIGNVSTARITDATPAGAMAHVAKRGCEGPVQTSASCAADAVENGGPGSIAEQSINLGVDVLLGGGADRYDQTIAGGPYAGKTVTDSAKDRGYSVLRNAADLSTAKQLPALGLFGGGHLPTELVGPQAAPGGVAATCTPNPAFTADVPTLEAMTRSAIGLLSSAESASKQGENGKEDRNEDNRDERKAAGFFLQVEGASIDKQDHAANPCAQIGETIAFDRAVQVALDFAKKDGNTTVIVTADHSHTSQIIPATDKDSLGATATLTTADGQPMKLSYGTSPTAGSQDHTGSTVPYLSYGPASVRVPSLLDHTDIFGIVNKALGLS